MKIRILILMFVTAVAVTSTAVAAEEKKQECNTYCNSVNMDGSGSVICQTVCS